MKFKFEARNPKHEKFKFTKFEYSKSFIDKLLFILIQELIYQPKLAFLP